MSFEKPWGNYLLENIIETPAPEGISFWPQTLAWKVIFVLLVLFVLKKAYQAWKTYQDNRYRREALAWLKQCSLNNEADVRQLPALLRKVALLSKQLMERTYQGKYNQGKNTQNSNSVDITVANKQAINQLTGEDWLIWLDKQCQKTSFSLKSTSSAISANQLLNTLAYSPHINFEDEKVQSALKNLIQEISLWVEYHQLSLPISTIEEVEAAVTINNKEGN